MGERKAIPAHDDLLGQGVSKEADVRKAIELTFSQINSGTGRQNRRRRVRRDHHALPAQVPSQRKPPARTPEKTPQGVPAAGTVVDAFMVTREDEIDEINLILKAAAIPEDINFLAE